MTVIQRSLLFINCLLYSIACCSDVFELRVQSHKMTSVN